MMEWYNLILTPDSLWLVWADTDMSENVDILTLSIYKWIIYNDCTGLSKIDYDHELRLDKAKPRCAATQQSKVAATRQSVVVTQ